MYCLYIASYITYILPHIFPIHYHINLLYIGLYTIYILFNILYSYPYSTKRTMFCTFYKQEEPCIQNVSNGSLIPKGQSPFFGPFLEFGQAIVDAIFVQKISNCW
jgi:hypothetical protein